MDHINRAAPGRPLPDIAEEADEPRNVRPRIAPSVDSSLQGLASRPDITSTSLPPMPPSASTLAGRASPPFIAAQAISPAFPARLEGASNMPPHTTHEDNLEVIEVFVTLAEILQLAPVTIANYQRILARFAKEMLADNPHADLRGFLQRYESSDKNVKSQALADRDRVIVHWHGDTRRHLYATLNHLIMVPPEERHLPEDSTRPQVRPSQLLERLPPEDRQRLRQLRDDSEQRDVAGQGLRDAGLLIRFGAALVEKGYGGLSEWLAMQGGARHADAKQLFEAYLAGVTPRTRRSLPAAMARLQSLAGIQNSDRIRTAKPVRKAKVRYAPDFPRAEAKSIDAAIAANKGRLQETSLYGYRRKLIHFSTWLRQQWTHDRPAYPGGLQDILEIDRCKDLSEVLRLRDQYLHEDGGADGSHKSMKAALEMLLRYHRSQPLQEGQSATPQPSLPKVFLDLNNPPDPDLLDSPELDLSRPQAAEVVASQPVEALPAAPPTRDLIIAMSRLRATRQHRAPESVADTARALGLDAGRLAAYVTDDGNLHTNLQVEQWLPTLPPNELDALLRFHENG